MFLGQCLPIETHAVETHFERKHSLLNRKLLWPAVGSLILVGLSAGIAFGNNGERNNKTFEYAIGLWGDLPYSDVRR
jgi:hypothetical protein